MLQAFLHSTKQSERKMGTHIFTSVEVKTDTGWAVNEQAVFTADPTWPGMEGKSYTDRPFFNQNYVLFTLLVGRRGVEGITPIGNCRGLPADATSTSVHELAGFYESTQWDDPDEMLTVDERIRRRVNIDRVGFSWMGVNELLSIDFDIQVPKRGDPGCMITLREALGGLFQKHMSQIISLGDPNHTRFLFCFED